MMASKFKLTVVCLLTALLTTKAQNQSIRYFVDTVGFANKSWQTDSVYNRIVQIQKKDLMSASLNNGPVKACICPHDDHAYVGYLYPATLQNINAKTIVLIGVAHKARLLNLQDEIVFDSYDYWHAPYANIKVSSLRNKLIEKLSDDIYTINDSMHKIEHSLEAMLPFLQKQNKIIEIIPILVPYMSFETINSISQQLAGAFQQLVVENNLEWGSDFAIVISNDAVHYGDEGWGGKNFARYGTDSAGYKAALAYEMDLINHCLTGTIRSSKIKDFTSFTVESSDYKQYKWTWCGRYSVPFGVSFANYLNKYLYNQPLNGKLIGYSTSISKPVIPVTDLNMGVTAPANLHHWVGYAGIIYF